MLLGSYCSLSALRLSYSLSTGLPPIPPTPTALPSLISFSAHSRIVRPSVRMTVPVVVVVGVSEQAAPREENQDRPMDMKKAKVAAEESM